MDRSYARGSSGLASQIHALRPRWALMVAGALILAGLAIVLTSALTAERDGSEASSPNTAPFDADRAYGYLVKVCRLGPRPGGSEAMRRQQELLVEHFEKHGGQVKLQSFDAVHPLNGQPVRMANLVVSWHPDADERVLVACHYDTRPFPDADPVNPRGVFIGANDGGSGVALLMELAHHVGQLQPTYGVDFVLFDGEELIYAGRGQTFGEYFLGSKHFATEYLTNPPQHRYVCGVLVDMVGDRSLNLYKEVNSVKFAPEVTDSLWQTARRLGVREFIDRRKHEVQDDHLPLNQIARIPTCDIIDFDYGPPRSPYWHTTQDLPTKCSGESLAKVGRVLLTWLESVPRIGQ